jgi:hypothetical protein
MSHEAILETIKTELDDADAATLQSVWETLRQAKQGSTELPVATGVQISRRTSTATTSEKSLAFIGENPPFDPNRAFSFKERAAEKRRLKAQNREWLLQKFKELHAGWLMVVDGQVIATGATLSDYPDPEQILEVCHRTEKFPFLFINEDLLAIEESGSAWHPTIDPNDFYPTVNVKFRSNVGTIDVIADLDTGAGAIFVDYDLLANQNVIQPKAQEQIENAHHLNQIFEYLPRKVTVEIVLASGEVRSQELKIACVAAWRKSPFVKINPNRTALVGRAVFLKLKPRILLDFDKQETKLWAPLQRRKKEKSQLTPS